MPKYRFIPVVYASLKPTEVEADSKEDALETAIEEFTPDFCLCWSCANEVELGDMPIESIDYVEEIE